MQPRAVAIDAAVARARTAGSGHEDAALENSGADASSGLAAYDRQRSTPPEIAARALAAGAVAPEVSLRDSTGRRWSLAAARRRGPVIVLFHRGHGDSFAHSQLRHFQQSLEMFERQRASAVAVSADAIESTREFAEEAGITYPMLADPDRTAIRAFGVEDPDAPRAWPAMFVIRRDGRISWRWLADRYRTHARSALILEILAALAADSGPVDQTRRP